MTTHRLRCRAAWRALIGVACLAALIAAGVPLAPGPAAAAGPALYPDLQTLPPADLSFDRAVLGDGATHHLLRFANTAWNAGAGRLELEGDPHPGGGNQIYQNLYDAPTGGGRVVHHPVSTDIVYHPSHYHYHFEGFASYLLLQRDGAGAYRETTKRGTKTSFCVMDTRRVAGGGPPSAQYGGCGSALQGLSVGWGDTYEAHLPEQWVDLGAGPLADGDYALQSTADPQNKIDEGGRDGNNVGTTYFRVRGGAIEPQLYALATGHTIGGGFLGYWEGHGGLMQFGHPLSQEFVQTLEDGRPYRVQYFERARLEYHPENAAPYDILLGQFGRRLHPADPPAAPRAGQAYFPETGHNVGAGFLRYWGDHGGLAQFGYPLSEEFREQLEDGNWYVVQYFERARFEYHPEHAAPYDILLGHFGRRILAETTGPR